MSWAKNAYLRIRQTIERGNGVDLYSGSAHVNIFSVPITYVDKEERGGLRKKQKRKINRAEPCRLQITTNVVQI